MTSRLRSYVERRLAELGMNAFEAAREGGLERGFINDILQGKKSNVRGNNLAKLARSLKISIGQLIEETSDEHLMPGMKDWIDKNPETLRDEVFETTDDIQQRYPKSKIKVSVAIYNLLKQANGETLIEPRPTSFIPEEDFTRDTRIDYAVVVYDIYMSPELNPGELALIDCNYPPVEGSNYLFKTEGSDFNTKICIAKLVSYDDEKWIIRQWKRKEEMILSRREWPSCHRVVGKIVR